MKSFIEIIEIIKVIEKEKDSSIREISDFSVAKLLNVADRSTFSKMKSRNTIPYEALLAYCQQRGVSFHWLLTEEGQKHIEPFTGQMPTGSGKTKQLLDAISKLKESEIDFFYHSIMARVYLPEDLKPVKDVVNAMQPKRIVINPTTLFESPESEEFQTFYKALPKKIQGAMLNLMQKEYVSTRDWSALAQQAADKNVKPLKEEERYENTEKDIADRRQSNDQGACKKSA